MRVRLTALLALGRVWRIINWPAFLPLPVAGDRVSVFADEPDTGGHWVEERSLYPDGDIDAFAELFLGRIEDQDPNVLAEQGWTIEGGPDGT